MTPLDALVQMSTGGWDPRSADSAAAKVAIGECDLSAYNDALRTRATAMGPEEHAELVVAAKRARRNHKNNGYQSSSRKKQKTSPAFAPDNPMHAMHERYLGALAATGWKSNHASALARGAIRVKFG